MYTDALNTGPSSVLRRAAIGLLLVGGMPVSASEESAGTLVLEPAEDGPVFTYRGRRGPEFWGGLDPSWTTCAQGEAQSPIDISGTTRRRLSGPVFDYAPSEIQVLNNGHTVEFLYHAGSSLTVDRNLYEVAQFHFHTPSEHSLRGGAQFPVEMHIVHRDTQGRLAVVGVMIREGSRNPALPNTRRWGQLLPREPGVVYELEGHIDLGALLPADTRNYRYRGSLTTPPCSEDVLWILMAEPIEVSRGQLSELREALSQLQFASRSGTNNRPTQPRNGRAIALDPR